MLRRAPALLLLCACAREPGVNVQIVPAPGLPAMDRVRLLVLQDGALLQEDKEDFALAGMSLPGTVLVRSWASHEGKLQIVAQGFSGTTVEARGETQGQLTRDSPYNEVTLVLVQLCSGSTCGLTPTTCAAQGAQCGTVDDQAGGYLDCGTCPAGETCGAGGAHRCAKGSCTPTSSCSSLDAGCGYVFDGCQMVSCGDCASPSACTVAHACSCTPTVSCSTSSPGCLPVDDGCGQMITCEHCTPPQTCDATRVPAHCGCAPQCGTGQACGAPDGCGGKCQTGTCPNDGVCSSGACTCKAGQTDCNGACVSLLTDPLNCGACGHVCSQQSQCSNGVCPCSTPDDNADHHCCPPAYDLQYSVDGFGPFCYSNAVFSATTLDTAEVICAGESACVGFGAVFFNGAPASIPLDAGCGSYHDGRVGTGSMSHDQVWVGTYEVGSSLHLTGEATCGNACDGGAMAPCTCDCSCTSPASGCMQSFYCVMDPLGPRKAICGSSTDCPGGQYCDAGACLPSSDFGCCVSAYHCDPLSPAKFCHRLGRHATGYCQ